MKSFNLQDWIERHRDELKPPVGNKCIYNEGAFIVMIVGGPNHRTDFHINQTDEFFYQMKGDIFLRIVNSEQKIEEVSIREGDVFMLPAGIPHSPQRMENSIGLVVEKSRTPSERDGLQWYCSRCNNKLYEEFFYLENIETQFNTVFNNYYNSQYTHCKNCGHINGKEWDA